MDPAVTPRPRRRDAARNRGLVLAAARNVFSVRGGRASLDEVATAAGLGVGTVHRAFGSRAALVEALFEAGLEDALDLIQGCASLPTGWDQLCEALWGLTELQLRNRGLHDMVFGSLDEAGNRVRARIEPPLAEIVERAKAEGRVRDDFTASDIAFFSRSVAASRQDASEDSIAVARRHVELLIKGIAATPDERFVPGPPDPGQPWQVEGRAGR